MARTCLAWQQVVVRAPCSGQVRFACQIWFLAMRGSVSQETHTMAMFLDMVVDSL